MSNDDDFLDINDILNSDDLKKEEVYIESWGGGGKLLLQEMTGAALDAYEAGLFKKKEIDGKITYERDHENARAKLIAHCVINPKTGDRMFKSEEQIKVLGSKNGAILSELHSKCARLNKIGVTDEEEDEGKLEADQ